MSESSLEAHGVLGCLAWGILAPLGALLIRAVPSTKAWVVHGGFMLLVLSLFTTNVGIGLWRVYTNHSYIGKSAHFILGTTLFVLAWCQPFVGLAHHYILKKTGKRTLLSVMHVFFGRIFMLVGVINGGVGLLLAKNTSRAEHIAYGTVVGIVWTSYVLVSLQLEVNRQQPKKLGEKDGSIAGSESSRVVSDEMRVVEKR